jgi:hypothetical protein
VTNLPDNSIFTNRNNRFAANTYSTGGISRPFQWMGGQGLSWPEWTAYGLDVGGSAS